MGREHNDLDARLNLQVDDEHRLVIIGTPEGLDGMTDEEVLALLRRLRELRSGYEAKGYTVTRLPSEHPKWRP